MISLILLLVGCDFDERHQAFGQARCNTGEGWTLNVWLFDEADAIEATSESMRDSGDTGFDSAFLELDEARSTPVLGDCGGEQNVADLHVRPILQAFQGHDDRRCDDPTWARRWSIWPRWRHPPHDGATTFICSPEGYVGEPVDTGF